jgi:hypothetical protein
MFVTSALRCLSVPSDTCPIICEGIAFYECSVNGMNTTSSRYRRNIRNRCQYRYRRIICHRCHDRCHWPLARFLLMRMTWSSTISSLLSLNFKDIRSNDLVCKILTRQSIRPRFDYLWLKQQQLQGNSKSFVRSISSGELINRID